MRPQIPDGRGDSEGEPLVVGTIPAEDATISDARVGAGTGGVEGQALRAGGVAQGQDVGVHELVEGVAGPVVQAQ